MKSPLSLSLSWERKEGRERSSVGKNALVTTETYDGGIGYVYAVQCTRVKGVEEGHMDVLGDGLEMRIFAASKHMKVHDKLGSCGAVEDNRWCNITAPAVG